MDITVQSVADILAGLKPSSDLTALYANSRDCIRPTICHESLYSENIILDSNTLAELETCFVQLVFDE